MLDGRKKGKRENVGANRYSVSHIFPAREGKQRENGYTIRRKNHQHRRLKNKGWERKKNKGWSDNA